VTGAGTEVQDGISGVQTSSACAA